MEKEGTIRIELAGKEDKRQLTAVLVGQWLVIFCCHKYFTREKQIAAFPMLISQLDGICQSLVERNHHEGLHQ